MEENQTEKIKIKSLCDNIEKLENFCEELQKLLDTARNSLEKSEKLQKRRCRKGPFWSIIRSLFDPFSDMYF